MRIFQSDTVHYAGTVVTFDGGAYQAQRDTGRAPTTDDWICIAAPGRNGSDGRSLRVRGTYKADEQYSALDIVATGGASFIARVDKAGSCPGDDWQLIARQGQRGVAGEKGERGPKGDKGELGPGIDHWEIDRKTYQVFAILSDRTRSAPIELRGLFEQFNDETR